MPDRLFDSHALTLRRARALVQGPRLFLAERIVEDLAERLALVRRRFQRGLLIGCPDTRLAEPLRLVADELRIGATLDDAAAIAPGSIDLMLVVGQFDTAEELPALLRVLRYLLAPEALLAGAFPGNDSLPMLRSAMLAADRASGQGISPRAHPRVSAAGFAGLLQDAGFLEPVVDLDRVRLRYRRFDDLVADLRGMAGTNVLAERSRRPLSRAARDAAAAAFAAAGDSDGTVETIELIHFAAWTPPENKRS